jgi:hypothetical protein
MGCLEPMNYFLAMRILLFMKLSLHLLGVKILKQVGLEFKGRERLKVMMGLIYTLIIRSVKTSNFGTKLTEDMAAAEICVNALETSICKFRTVLIIFTLAYTLMGTLPISVCSNLAVREASLFSSNLVLWL